MGVKCCLENLMLLPLYRKHNITGRAKDAAVAGYNRLADLNRKHKVTDKAGEAMHSTYESAKAFNEKHQVLF